MLINPGEQDKAPAGKPGAPLVLVLRAGILQLQHTMFHTADHVERHHRGLSREFIQGQGLDLILPSIPQGKS